MMMKYNIVKDIEDKIMGILDMPWRMTPEGLIQRKVFIENEGAEREVLSYRCTFSRLVNNCKARRVDLVTTDYPFHMDLHEFDTVEAKERNNDILVHVR